MGRRFVPLLAVLAACSLSRTVEVLDRESPPHELGRPVWVTAPATGGAWVGGVFGWAGSVLTLPLTFPVTLLADDPLGYSKDEFMFWGTSIGAGTGHVVLGVPLDTFDYLFRRAWVAGPEVTIDDEREPIPVAPIEQPTQQPSERPTGQATEASGTMAEHGG